MKFHVSTFLFVCVLVSQLAAASPAVTPVADSNEQLVQKFVAAFNAQNAEAMTMMVTDDVQWLTVDGQKVSVETSSKEELRKSMVGYFKSCPSCKSRIATLFSTGSRVSALEIASHETPKGMREHRSLAVYEFSGSLVKRVYYFPVEK